MFQPDKQTLKINCNMGDVKSRKQTEDVAMQDARRKAAEAALTFIKSETHIKDAVLEKDLFSA